MKIRALDGTHDWKFGKGLSSYAFDNQAIGENIQTRLLSWLNDCWFDAGAGLDWPRLLGSRNTQKLIELSARAIILQSYGVIRVTEIIINFQGTARNLVLNYKIDTLFSTDVEGTVGI
jgi:hypothetical protein